MQCARLGTSLIYVLLSCFGIWFLFDGSLNGETYEEILEIHVDESEDNSLIDEYRNCTVDTCMNLMSCSLHDSQLTIYVEPILRIIDKDGEVISPTPSREFLQLRSTVKDSIYRVDEVEEACFVLPGIDTLNMYWYSSDKRSFRRSLKMLEQSRKRNYLFFNFVGDYSFDLKAVTARAILAKPFFRHAFHVPLPIWDPYIKEITHPFVSFSFLIIVPIRSATHGAKTFLSSVFSCESCLILDGCETDGHCDRQGKLYDLEEMMQVSEFTLVDDRVPNHDLLLMKAMRASSIPVIISESIVLPFSEIIDWKRISLSFHHNRLPDVLPMLKSITVERKQKMRDSLKMVFKKYLMTFEKIVLTTLKILERRIIPNSMASDDEKKSEPIEEDRPYPFFVARHVPSEGFSVILAIHNAVPLFTLIRLLAKVPDLKCLVVVWTSDSSPPPSSQWPEINRPIHVINKGAYHFQNRFIPYPEICTEAVLSLEDDVSLSVSDIEFMYRVWRENSKRFISYIPRGDISKTYASTSGLFYHRHYGTAMQQLPDEIRMLIEKNVSCKDIGIDIAIKYITGRNKLSVFLDNYSLCFNCTISYSKRLITPRNAQQISCIKAAQALRNFKLFGTFNDMDLIAISAGNAQSIPEISMCC